MYSYKKSHKNGNIKHSSAISYLSFVGTYPAALRQRGVFDRPSAGSATAAVLASHLPCPHPDVYRSRRPTYLETHELNQRHSPGLRHLWHTSLLNVLQCSFQSSQDCPLNKQRLCFWSHIYLLDLHMIAMIDVLYFSVRRVVKKWTSNVHVIMPHLML